MDPNWYRDAVIYGIDVEFFLDGNGDGCGDFEGLIQKIPYLADLGITCLWLLPFFPSPNGDNGYDVEDYYRVDDRIGTLEDFDRLLHIAGQNGIKVIIELVANHTSDQHPWFQASRRDKTGPFREFYVWTDSPPPTPLDKGNSLEGHPSQVWQYDDKAGAYYYHRFYPFQPELNFANPEVIKAIKQVMAFWLSFDIAGFRVDAASNMITEKGIASSLPKDGHGILKDFRSYLEKHRPGTVLLGETDVPVNRSREFFGCGDELHLSFNFYLINYLTLSLVRMDATPVALAIQEAQNIPENCKWANFLRTFDELNLEQLSEEERKEVFEVFAPEEEMRIFRGRGIRRRMGSMLEGNQARLKMAYSLIYSLPGTPLIMYGDEIGMSENLELPGRNSVRTPMQWSSQENAAFSTASEKDLVKPLVRDGPFGYKKINVEDQKANGNSLWAWIRKASHIRRGNKVIGWGEALILDTDNSAVLAHAIESQGSTFMAVHNFSDQTQKVQLLTGQKSHDQMDDLLKQEKIDLKDGAIYLELEPYGFRWYQKS